MKKIKIKNKHIGLKHYLAKHKFAVSIYVALIIIACASSGLTTILFSNFLSVTISGQFATSLRVLLFAGTVLILQRFCWWFSNCLYIKLANLIWVEIAKDLTNRSFQLTSSTFTENSSGGFIQHIMDDPNRALENLSYLVENFASVATGMVVIIYIVTLNWLIGSIYVVILIGLFIMELYRKKIKKINTVKTKAINDKTYSLVGEIIKSEKDIKALGLEEKLYSTTNEGFNKLKRAKNKQNITDTHFWCGRCLILEIFGVLILALGLHMMQKEILTLATYVLIFSYRDNLYGLVWYVGDIVKCLTEVQVSTTRMFNMFNEDMYAVEKFGTKTIADFKGKVEFNNVEFAYSEIEEETEEQIKERKKRKLPKVVKHIKQKPIFKDLSFEIEPNSTVAFVGKSGSGKSTILSLIAKLIETDCGSVKIDGINIKDLTKETLRNNISLINQFPYIFDMTIKENLLLVKKDATDEEIWNVLERASFADTVKAMAKGIDTKVGETGVKLSGGQRQRLAIARALLKQTKIILFDESTSSLDNFAQSHIQKSIEAMKGKHTVVIVAHRLSTIRNVDKIYFLDKGNIVDSGTFDELYASNDQFKNMFLIENIETKN